jgi:Uri superfamily endonuclease
MAPTAAEAQTYQLYIQLKRNVRITVGKLGTFDFPAGNYIYTGSAKHNLTARIRRHLSKEKKLRWHIDYLLTNPACSITRVETFTTSECRLNQKSAGEVIVPHFGASDCKAGCRSHLKFIRQPDPTPARLGVCESFDPGMP